jgi:hypothetical protein
MDECMNKMKDITNAYAHPQPYHGTQNNENNIGTTFKERTQLHTTHHTYFYVSASK